MVGSAWKKTTAPLPNASQINPPNKQKPDRPWNQKYDHTDDGSHPVNKAQRSQLLHWSTAEGNSVALTALQSWSVPTPNEVLLVDTARGRCFEKRMQTGDTILLATHRPTSQPLVPSPVVRTYIAHSGCSERGASTNSAKTHRRYPRLQAAWQSACLRASRRSPPPRFRGSSCESLKHPLNKPHRNPQYLESCVESRRQSGN